MHGIYFEYLKKNIVRSFKLPQCFQEENDIGLDHYFRFLPLRRMPILVFQGFQLAACFDQKLALNGKTHYQAGWSVLRQVGRLRKTFLVCCLSCLASGICRINKRLKISLNYCRNYRSIHKTDRTERATVQP